MDWTLFVVGLVLGILGIEADLEGASMASHIADIATLMGPDFEGLRTAFQSGDLSGEILAIAGAIFDTLQAIWGHIIENIAIGFFMWLTVASNFVIDFVPGVLEAKLIILGISTAIGMEGLWIDGCI